MGIIRNGEPIEAIQGGDLAANCGQTRNITPTILPLEVAFLLFSLNLLRILLDFDLFFINYELNP